MYSVQQIGIYLCLSPKALGFTGLFACSLLKPYIFALDIALTGWNKGNSFYSPPTTLSSSLAEVRFASLVDQYNRDLAQWERQVQEKQKPAEKQRPPEKQSVRERLRQLQAEGKQKPGRRKSFDRER